MSERQFEIVIKKEEPEMDANLKLKLAFEALEAAYEVALKRIRELEHREYLRSLQ